MIDLKHIMILFAALLISVVDASALSLPVKRVNGKAYYYYTVGKKDRFYELPSKIGVKRSDIVKYNPQAADGLQSGMVLTFPVELDAEILKGYYTTSYTPGKDESIYGVAKHFDVPVDRIIEFNPAANEGIHNLTLVIPLEKAVIESDNTLVETPSNQGKTMPYIVLKGETLTKIAKKFNISVNDIIAVNEGMNPDKVAARKRILIPVVEPVGDVAAVPETVADTAQETEVVEISADTAVEEIVPVKPLKIALLLPFMLNEDTPSKATQLITEFYRGFLLAAETLSHSGEPVTIYAYDTESSSDTVAAIVRRPEMQDVNLIVGPGDEEQLSILANHTNGNGGYLLNAFAVKDSSYLTERSMIQANIPHERMYDKAICYFVENRFKGFTPVFLSRVDGAADKIEFVTRLKERLAAENIPYREIAYRNFLGQDNLEDLNMTDSSYVFIPVSGSRIEFNKFAPALKNFKESVSLPSNVILFGYPEWITFRNEQLDMLQALNTVIYSRFFGIADSPLAAKLNDDYRNAYGLEMMDAAPNQGLLGYDTAVFIIRSLRNNEGDFSESSMDYDGVQSGFSLIHPNNAKGLVNDNLYFIDFMPGGVTTKTQY